MEEELEEEEGKEEREGEGTWACPTVRRLTALSRDAILGLEVTRIRGVLFGDSEGAKIFWVFASKRRRVDRIGRRRRNLSFELDSFPPLRSLLKPPLSCAQF